MSMKPYIVSATVVLTAMLSGAAANAKPMQDIDGKSFGTSLVRSNSEQVARKGADNRPGDTRGGRGRDDGRNHAFLFNLDGVQLARQGADDGAGHVRHGRGSDDGAGDHHQGRGNEGAGHGGHGGDDRRGDDHGRRG